MKFNSMEEFRQYYFPEALKKRKDLEAEGVCPECEGTGKTEYNEYTKAE